MRYVARFMRIGINITERKCSLLKGTTYITGVTEKEKVTSSMTETRYIMNDSAFKITQFMQQKS
jgi:hypothetical protein